ncbi:MAG: HD domain-containing protein [archaeon]
MRTIRDAIHGTIGIDDLETDLLDAPEMQRLRGVKQLGFAYLVYPSATHTRFEHSLGAYYLARKLARYLELKPEDAQKVRTAALLHDIGHGPFSHTTEVAVSDHIDVHHEEKTVELIKNSSITEILKKHNLDPLEIAGIATGKKLPLGEIVSGEIDVDRMDYLVRDAYYTGAAYGVIDLDRLLLTATMYKGKLCIKEEGLAAVEALVFARYLMYPAVYQHHTSRIANSMFSAAIVECLKDKLFSAEELYDMDDIELISKLRLMSTFSGEMMQRLEHRKLYKRAIVLSREELGPGYKKLLSLRGSKLEGLQRELAETCDLKEGELLLDIPKAMYASEATTEIIYRGKPTPISNISPLLKALRTAQWSYWKVGVYCDKQHREKVKQKAENILLGYVQ